MTAAERTLTTTRRLLALSVGLAGLCAASIQAVASSWLAAAAALLATTAWMASRHPRRASRADDARSGAPARGGEDALARGRIATRADLLVQASFLVLGVLMVAGLAFRLLPVAVVGMWLLVCAADLDRLLVRYPSDSPARVQRATLTRHLKLLGFVGGTALALVGVTVLVAIEVRLPAVMLVAAFVVVVLVRIVRSISRGEAPGDTGPE